MSDLFNCRGGKAVFEEGSEKPQWIWDDPMGDPISMGPLNLVISDYLIYRTRRSHMWINDSAAKEAIRRHRQARNLKKATAKHKRKKKKNTEIFADYPPLNKERLRLLRARSSQEPMETCGESL